MKGDDLPEKLKIQMLAQGRMRKELLSQFLCMFWLFPSSKPSQAAAPGGRPGDGGLSMRHHAMGSHPGGHLLLQDSGDGFVKALGELSAKRICSLGPVVCEEHDVGGDMRALQGSCSSPHRAAWFA